MTFGKKLFLFLPVFTVPGRTGDGRDGCLLNVSFTLVTGHKHKLMLMFHVYWICHNNKGMSYNIVPVVCMALQLQF